MNTSEAGELQIHTVVEHGPDGGVCVVRCVGGVLRPGQVFAARGLTGTVRLDRVEKYGRSLEFIDPPHSALIHLSGGPLVQLRYGDALVSVPEGTALPEESGALATGRVDPDWRRRLEACGLRLVGLGVPPGFPEVLRAHHVVRRHQDRPAPSVRDARPGAGAELDRLWDSLTTTTTRLASPTGEFYVMPPDPRGHDIGWARVRDLVGTGLPSRVLAATGRAAFTTVSLDGGVLSAVTEEETGKRIVVRTDDWKNVRVAD